MKLKELFVVGFLTGLLTLVGCTGGGGSNPQSEQQSSPQDQGETPDNKPPFTFFELTDDKLTTPRNTNGNDDCYASMISSSGSLFCAGYTTSDLGDTNSNKDSDAFIMKTSRGGTVGWVFQAGLNSPLANYGTVCRSLAEDSEGNIICAGNLTVQLSNSNNSDAWVLKISPKGQLIWSFHLSNDKIPNGSVTFTDRCDSVLVDGNDNIICVGRTSGQLGESSGGGSSLNSDIFYMKLSKAGALVWIKQMGSVTKPVGGSTSGNDYPTRAVIDRDGSFYFCGTTNGALVEANGGSYDIVWGKISAQGQLIWTKQLGQVTAGSTYGVTEADHCSALALDSSRSRLYFGGSTSSALTQVSGGGIDAYFAAASTVNGNIQWVRHWGQTHPASIRDTSNIEAISSIKVNAVGEVIILGNVIGQGEFVEPIGATNTVSGSDPFVAKYNTAGDFVWIKHIGQTSIQSLGIPAVRSVSGYGLDLTEDGTSYISGVRNLTSSNRQLFFLKVNPRGTF